MQESEGICKSMWEYVGTQEYERILGNMQEYVGIYRNSAICMNIKDYARVYGNMKEYENISRNMAAWEGMRPGGRRRERERGDRAERGEVEEGRVRYALVQPKGFQLN